MVSDVLSEDISDTSQRVRGRPFQRGVSPCPGGAAGKRSRLLAQFQAELGDLGAIDQALLRRAVDALCAADSKVLSSADKTKALNAANRIIGAIRERQNAKAGADDSGALAVLAELGE